MKPHIVSRKAWALHIRLPGGGYVHGTYWTIPAEQKEKLVPFDTHLYTRKVSRTHSCEKRDDTPHPQIFEHSEFVAYRRKGWD